MKLDRVDEVFISCLICFGVGFSVFGVGSGLDTMSFVDEAEQAEGTVTNLEERREWGRRLRANATYAAVDFTTQEGRQVDIDIRTSWLVRVGEVGDDIDVLYLEDAPQDAKVNSFGGVWGNTISHVASAALMFTLSVLVFVSAKRGWRKGRPGRSSRRRARTGARSSSRRRARMRTSTNRL